MTNHGDIQINSTDYDGDIVVEQFSYWNGTPCWAVPAWDERGLAALAGPFASIEEAQAALRETEGLRPLDAIERAQLESAAQ